MTIEKWDKLWHLKKLEKFTKNGLRTVDKKDFVPEVNKCGLDTEKLAMKMAELLNVRGRQVDDKTLPIELRKGAIKYEDDEIVNHSLARFLEMKISNELMKINKITGIEIKRQKEDLIFLIHF